MKSSKAKNEVPVKVTPDIMRKAKEYGFSDRQLSEIWGMNEAAVRMMRKKMDVIPVYKTVDTCAAEFAASTPYHYSTYERENESLRSTKKKVIILGGGPNRIGQGIEFDYCCVHGVMALREEGFETIMVNCNPETVSTDYDTTDKLYFEPLTLEDVLNICDQEQPDGVIVAFGGQTPLKIAKALDENGVKILGTSPEGIDLAEDRERFGALLRRNNIQHPKYGTAYTVNNAVLVADQISFPVLVRPSYVLGGRAMEVCYTKDALREYMRKAVDVSPDHPVLIDRFLEDAFEYDVDCVCDGKDVMIGGVMQHIEEAGIHSGDSACVLPPYMMSEKILNEIMATTVKLAKALKVVGLMNVQFASKDDVVYVLEVNPRASRTVPFVSKATGLPLAKIAAKVMVGRTLEELGCKDFDFRKIKHISVKEAVFPFAKFPKTRVFLGPEMRSTGEVMGISDSFGASIAKSQIAASNALPNEGTVFFSVNDNDKTEMTLNIARELRTLGFSFIATEGTAGFFTSNSIPCEQVFKVNESRPNSVDLIKNGKIQLVINTPLGETSRYDEYAIGWAALENKVAFITTLSAAATAVKAIQKQKEGGLTVKSIQEYLKEGASKY
ncbi:MAG: carbamoyl-phosphate synthase large subunit [Ignavibacteriales bacterium]|nr:carbamoyl-phosphate synthase large subunit [Ignavibacteriales bacterium]